MIIEKKNTADLLPADYNPRKDLKPGDAEYEKLKRSIEQFGYVEPVIWNQTTGRVVGGHQRLKVLMDMGMTEVDCVVVAMDEEKEKALNIALNKISGDWDKDKLALLIADLQGADFDVSLTGFEPAEIDALFKDTLKDGVKDDDWERQGFLQTTEGNVVHYGYIEKFIERLGERYNIREIAFDRWGAVQMVQNLEGMGFTVVPFGQGFKDMSPPTKELMKLVLEEKVAHGGHPVLRWMMDNIFIRTDPAGNIKPDKEKSTEKIDGAVATIMALDRAIRCGNDSSASVYDDRGILFI